MAKADIDELTLMNKNKMILEKERGRKKRTLNKFR